MSAVLIPGVAAAGRAGLFSREPQHHGWESNISLEFYPVIFFSPFPGNDIDVGERLKASTAIECQRHCAQDTRQDRKSIRYITKKKLKVFSPCAVGANFSLGEQIRCGEQKAADTRCFMGRLILVHFARKL